MSEHQSIRDEAATAAHKVVREAGHVAEYDETLEIMLAGYRQTVLGWGGAASPYHAGSPYDRAWKAGRDLAQGDLPRASLPPEPEDALAGWDIDAPRYLPETGDGSCMAGPTSARWRCFATRRSDRETVLGISNVGPAGEPPTPEAAVAAAKASILRTPREPDAIFLQKVYSLMQVARDRRIALALCRERFAAPRPVAADANAALEAALDEIEPLFPDICSGGGNGSARCLARSAIVERLAPFIRCSPPKPDAADQRAAVRKAVEDFLLVARGPAATEPQWEHHKFLAKREALRAALNPNPDAAR